MRLESKTKLINGLFVAASIFIAFASGSMFVLSGSERQAVDDKQDDTIRELQEDIRELKRLNRELREAKRSKRNETAVPAKRYATVAAEYFRAGNPNALTYRLGEPWIDRKSFSSKQRAVIHRENGGVCQVCGSSGPLEVEHRRGIQNGGGNERSNLGSLCKKCHGKKTSMDKSLRRQRDKLLKERRQ